MVKRHERLTVTNRILAETAPPVLPGEALDLTVGEARQIFASVTTDVFDYLRPSPAVPLGGESSDWGRRRLPSHATLREAFGALNGAIHRGFRYVSGSTENWTPLSKIWKARAGVCQDFAWSGSRSIRPTTNGAASAMWPCLSVGTSPTPRLCAGRSRAAGGKK
jgi:transglutaminase-like putative cysteine protease